MSDTPRQPAEYRPEDGAEVRPAARYHVGPGGLEALARTEPETAYRSLSLLAVAAFGLAACYSCLVALGGLAAFWFSAWWVLILGTILVPLLSIPVALKFNIREPARLLGFAGLALAAFYAVPVGVGGLIAFPSQSPWLLPLWTLLFPLAAGGAGVAAVLRIQNSEGTLSGILLAKWAVGLSLFFALCYTAFYTATYLAIRSQSVQFADEWIDRLQKDDLERAFALTIPPQYRGGNDAVARDNLELTHNSRPGEDGLGAFSSFSQKGAVRLLRGSTKQNVELVAVRDWGYESGGYKVQLSYRVATPNWTFPLELTVAGVESPKGDYKGRRWCVDVDQSVLARVEPQLSDRGKRLFVLAQSGHSFAEDWVKKLWKNEFLALDDTLPPTERQPEAVAGAVGLSLRATQASAPFFRGSLVRGDEKLFWAPPRIRQPILDNAKKLYSLGGDKPDAFRLRESRVPWPNWEEDNGRLLFRYDAELLMTVPITIETPEGREIKSAKAAVEGRLVLSCSATALTSEAVPEWRIESMELLHGRRLEEAAVNAKGQKGQQAGAQR